MIARIYFYSKMRGKSEKSNNTLSTVNGENVKIKLLSPKINALFIKEVYFCSTLHYKHVSKKYITI